MSTEATFPGIYIPFLGNREGRARILQKTTWFYWVCFFSVLPSSPHSPVPKWAQRNTALAHTGPPELRWACQGQESGRNRCGSGDSEVKTQLPRHSCAFTDCKSHSCLRKHVVQVLSWGRAQTMRGRDSKPVLIDFKILKSGPTLCVDHMCPSSWTGSMGQMGTLASQLLRPASFIKSAPVIR